VQHACLGSDRKVFEAKHSEENPVPGKASGHWEICRRKGGYVFVELMPMLAGRTVMITVAREDDKTLRVNAIPKKMKDDENPALTTPLSYTGTPEELDRELGKHLASCLPRRLP
jgi:hypothetical protein